MLDFLQNVNHVIWGGPTLILILGTGIWLSIRTGLIQFRYFPKALRYFWGKMKFDKKTQHGISPRQALCTALAATVGTGNLAGVAGAIAIGGPGAVFWMWVCAFGGMILKFAEATLSVRYRCENAQHESVGGPMYMIRRGMGHKWHFLASFYSFFGIIAAFGVGNATQINTLVGSLNSVLEVFGTEPSGRGNVVLGLGLAVLVGAMLAGGARRIGNTAEKLVPFAAATYILISLGVLGLRYSVIPSAFKMIVKGAFTPSAVTGGIIGSAFQSLRVGVSRGVFTNEAGMGTAGIAHGAATVNHPVEQGLMGIVEVFLDTIVICTLTALVILCSGVGIPYGTDSGIQLTTAAFSTIYGSWVQVLIAACVCCFALATILGWGLYGARCAQYLFGDKAWKTFAIIQVIIVIIGAILKTQTVWIAAEIVNGLMAVPNIIALVYLTPELIRLIKEYKQKY